MSIAAAACCFFDLVHVLPVGRRTLEVSEGLAVGASLILLTGGATTEAASELIARRGEHVMFKPPDLNALRPMIERLARL